MRLNKWETRLILLGAISLILFGSGHISKLGIGSVYQNQWEVRARLGGVTVAGKGTGRPDFKPPGWDARGSYGASRMYFDPDGQFKPSMGLPNCEVEVGDIHSKYSWSSQIGAWSKRLVSSQEITVGTKKEQYVVEEYTFEVRLGATADITHVHSFWGANDRFETETTYDRAGSIPGDPAEITAWPVFEISPWEKRGENGERIGAWIMKANIAKYEIFKNEVEAYAKQGTHWETGKCIVMTNPGTLNMFTDIKGQKLQQYEFQPGVAPSSSMRTSVALPVTATLQPGYFYDSMYADAGELKYVPRDVVFVIKVEVLRTREWIPESSRMDDGDKDKDYSGEGDDQGDKDQDPWIFLKSVPPELWLLIAIIGGIIIVVVLAPYLGIYIPLLMSRRR